MKKLILSSDEYIRKMALIEGDKISEFFIEKYGEEEITGNFYKGRVVDVVEGMESIFVDIGLEKNAFLNVSNFKNKKFNKYDEILVQVEKEPRDEKGAKLTLDFSISSKNLVLLPASKQVSISSKIIDVGERERLKEIFSNIEHMGLIIRTSATSIQEGTLIKEYKNLDLKWENIKKKFEQSKSCRKIYTQNSIVEKIFQEFLDNNLDEIVVDNEKIFQEIIEYIEERKLENLKSKIKRYFKEENIFDFYGVNIDIENALRKKVWLPSGGYLVIEKTEALVSIDVNTGRNIQAQNLEKIIIQTNIEACTEIARQLKLRNLGGIIIIDFIDMKKNNHRKLILKTLENELKNDRMKTDIINFSSLNLVQLTRQRKGKELSYYYQEPCSYCNGTGFVKSEDSIILEILKELKNIITEKDINKIELISKSEIIKRIKKDFIDYIKGILEKENKKINFIEEDFLEEDYKINLYKR